MIIRTATIDDAKTIHAMVSALARHTGKENAVSSTPEDFVRNGFGANPAFSALIAENDGEAMGLALFFPEFSTWRGARGVYLQDLYVSKSARGAGLGRRLVAAVAAASPGAAYMRLCVDAANDSAASFYRTLGFDFAVEDQVYMLSGAQLNALQEE